MKAGNIQGSFSLMQIITEGQSIQIIDLFKKGHFKQIWIHGYSNNWKVWDK